MTNVQDSFVRIGIITSRSCKRPSVALLVPGSKEGNEDTNLQWHRVLTMLRLSTFSGENYPPLFRILSRQLAHPSESTGFGWEDKLEPRYHQREGEFPTEEYTNDFINLTL